MIFVNIDDLIKGSIDMHMHPGLIPGFNRVDVLEAARQAKQAEMKAIVVKSHEYSAATAAVLAKRLVPDLKSVR